MSLCRKVWWFIYGFCNAFSGTFKFDEARAWVDKKCKPKEDNDTILILMGKSSTGKDTIAKHIKMLGYKFIVSHTNRPMREGEREGKPYYFRTKQEMLEMIANDEFIECREYNTLLNGKPDVWYYGVHKDAVLDDKKYVVVLDVVGMRDFVELYPDRVKTVYVQSPDSTREDRAKTRGGFDKSEWNRRLRTDEEDFKGIEKEVDLVVDNFNKSIDEIVLEISSKLRLRLL